MKRILGFFISLIFALSAQASEEKIGVLFSSFGDVDSEEEIEPFVKKTLSDPDVVPVPRWMKPIIVQVGWEFEKENIIAEYRAIGGASNFRARSQSQAEKVAAKLRERGHDARGYTGFTMTFPFISEGLEKARRDGISRLVIFYQGAQWSRPTSYIVYRKAAQYLAKHPDWDVRVTMVRSFSDDARFQALLTKSIQARLDTDFAGLNPSEVCIVLPAHGNPIKFIELGDPAYDQMMRVFRAVRQSFPAHKVFHGFQNHSELPTLKWTQPDMDDVIRDVAKAECSHVLINGRTSFTIDSLETLYDHAIAETADLRAAAPHKKALVEPMFNDSPSFTSFLSLLAEDALNGKGDLAELR